MWDFLNWLELSSLRKEVEHLKQIQYSNQKTLSEELKELFSDLYRNDNDISKLDLSKISHVRKLIENEFSVKANRILKDNYSFFYIILFIISMFIFSFIFIKWIVLEEYTPFFIKIICIMSGVFAAGYFLYIKDTFNSRRKYYSNLKSSFKTALYLKNKYPYLSPYGIYLKFVIDSSLKDVLEILYKNSSKKDVDKTLKNFYSLFDLETDTELLSKYENFFWYFDYNTYKMLEGTFKLPKDYSVFEKMFLIMLIIVPIFLAVFSLRTLIYKKFKFDSNINFLKVNCYLKDKESCKKLANLYKEDNSLHIKFLKKACEVEDKSSCKLLGDYFYNNGDIDKSLVFYEKACNLNDGLSCFFVARIFEKKYHLHDSSLFFYKKACDFNISEACYMIGSNFYLDKFYDKAFNYFKRACNMGDKYGCFYAGSMCIRGEVKNCDEYDNKIMGGISFYIKSCNLNNGAACFILGYYFYGKGLYGIQKDYNKAIFYIKKACDFNYTRACKYVNNK